MAEIRQVDDGDRVWAAAGIAQLKAAVWPEERADVAYLAAALAQPDRATWIAEADGSLVGFADGFLTLAEDGSRRWELDLLAVVPVYQGRGLGRALIAACTEAGRDFGATFARALIRASNTPSQRAFRHAGYTLDPAPLILWIATDGAAEDAPLPPDAYLIPVITLGYRGVWIEGRPDEAVFRAARTIRARHGWDSAGAVLPLAEVAANAAARQAGFTPLGDPPSGGWAWWRRRY